MDRVFCQGALIVEKSALETFFPILWVKSFQLKKGEILSRCGFSHWHDTCYCVGEYLTEIDGFQVLSERRLSMCVMLLTRRSDMFRNIFSSRLIQVGLVFFVVVVGGSLLYGWHVQRTTKVELARADAALQDVNRGELRTAADTADTGAVDFEHAKTPLEGDEVQPMSDETVAVPSDAAAPNNLSDAFLPDDFVSEEEVVEDVPISPFGFGAYPEIPADFPFPEASLPWTWSEEEIDNLEKLIQPSLKARGASFTEHMKQTELMFRVGIKLWNEGHSFVAVFCISYVSSQQGWAGATAWCWDYDDGHAIAHGSVGWGHMQNGSWATMAYLSGLAPDPDGGAVVGYGGGSSHVSGDSESGASYAVIDGTDEAGNQLRDSASDSIPR